MRSRTSSSSGLLKVPPLAGPQLGSRASSRRAWRLWLARRSQGSGRPTTVSGLRAAQPQCPHDNARRDGR
eukprot:scaffold19886_cov30-Phaeocystis_antarctica.AAC.1